MGYEYKAKLPYFPGYPVKAAEYGLFAVTDQLFPDAVYIHPIIAL